MGFNETNTSQKIRISLSQKAMLTIEDDMTAFEVPKLTTFINQVISNFWDIAESSIDNYISNKELELKEKLSASSIDSHTIKQAIQILLKDEKKRLINKTASYDNGNTVNKQYNINNNNYIFLTEECTEDKYYATAAKYLRCLIEEYCQLPFIKRERIYKRSSYTTVENACKNHNILKVKALIDGTQKLLYVYPCMIMPDPLATQEYLVCYVKNENSSTGKHIASFSMARLQLQGSALKQTFRLTKDDIIAIEKKLADSSPAYLLGTNEKVVVKLTERGQKSYKTKLYSRPAKEPESSGDTYVFYCSPLQAYNYFFPFGKEAEIIKPTSLRERFKNSYNDGADRYRS